MVKKKKCGFGDSIGDTHNVLSVIDLGNGNSYRS